jgi:hypothetical protein
MDQVEHALSDQSHGNVLEAYTHLVECFLNQPVVEAAREQRAIENLLQVFRVDVQVAAIASMAA